jgi:hypothetical protein
VVIWFGLELWNDLELHVHHHVSLSIKHTTCQLLTNYLHEEIPQRQQPWEESVDQTWKRLVVGSWSRRLLSKWRAIHQVMLVEDGCHPFPCPASRLIADV